MKRMKNELIGAYKLKQENKLARFVAGGSSFQISDSAIIYVKQVDKEYRKVLIDFGGAIDWMHQSVVDLFDKLPNET